MALTSADGRIATPSGSSLPPELSQLIASQMAASGSSGGRPGVFLDIALNSGPDTKQVRVEGKGWRTVDSGNKQRFSSLEEAVNSFYMLDDKYREDLQKRMWYLGLIDGPNNAMQAIGAWEKAVTMAWNYRAAGKDANPFDMLTRMTNLKAGQLSNVGPESRARTTTQRQINFTDPEQAKSWLREAFQSSMGRDPHDAEIRSMLRAIADGNKSDPQVIQTSVDADGNTTQQVIDPGFDPTAYIKNQTADDPEARAYEAANVLYPALMQAIASPV